MSTSRCLDPVVERLHVATPQSPCEHRPRSHRSERSPRPPLRSPHRHAERDVAARALRGHCGSAGRRRAVPADPRHPSERGGADPRALGLRQHRTPDRGARHDHAARPLAGRRRGRGDEAARLGLSRRTCHAGAAKAADVTAEPARWSRSMSMCGVSLEVEAGHASTLECSSISG